MDSNVKRGDIFYADLSPVVGSEQGGTRPVLIVQNDVGNTAIRLRSLLRPSPARLAKPVCPPTSTSQAAASD